MANLIETATWQAAIPQLEITDQVLGGVGGPDNRAPLALACRTFYLKVEVEKRSMVGHTHGQAEVGGLVAALAGKAPQVHAHNIGDVSDLVEELASKAAYTHVHTIGAVTGLQAALDGKAPAAHVHGFSQVTGLQAALDGKAPVTHGHAIADVTGLQAALGGKAAAVHRHVFTDMDGAASFAQVAGLQAALDAKQALLPLGAVINQDFDQLLTSGWIRIMPDESQNDPWGTEHGWEGYTHTPAPVGLPGGVLEVVTVNGMTVQRYYDREGARVTRVRFNGVWTAWELA